MATALAVMARYPEPGKVKTRLAAEIGVERATALYRAFILDLQARFSAGPRPLVWMYQPGDAPFESLVGAESIRRPQQGANLGERMLRCFATLFDEGFERVIMLGADIPHVEAAHLDEAERCLDDHDVVLGPSADGGYYLVAMRQPHDLFSMVTMGTSRVLDDTLRLVRRAGLRAHLLAPSFDIDIAADLRRLHEMLRHGNACGLPRTAALLERIYG
jgi:rSAM/selenodomain-associated transferase 1